MNRLLPWLGAMVLVAMLATACTEFDEDERRGGQAPPTSPPSPGTPSSPQTSPAPGR